jgi:RNA polymerase sigma-70 factor (ECF subfamily)
MIRLATALGGRLTVRFAAIGRDLKDPAVVLNSTVGTQQPTEQEHEHNLDLETLYQDHAAAMYRVAVAVVRNPLLAEDVVQESLIKAWLGLEHFRGESQLRTWLLRIVHNTAVSELRRLRDTLVDPLEMPERAAPSAEAEAMDRALMAAFEDALFELDNVSRAVVTLRELEGLSYEEITEVLNVPLSTVKTRLFRARKELMDELREWRDQS